MSPNESLASVAQLEALKSRSETYSTFYELYNDAELSRYGAHLLLRRVLYIDETEDRSTHFAVMQADRALLPPIRKSYDKLGAPQHFVPYRADDFLIAATDGNSIAEYNVLEAHGIYRAHLNATDQSYRPIHERVHLTFRSEQDSRLYSANFNLETGDGTVRFGEVPLGWILSETESQNLRGVVLQPAAELGHIAVAS